MDDLTQVHSTQKRSHLLRIIIRALAEDEHFGVIIDSEGFLRKLVIYRQVSDLGIMLKCCSKLKSQLPLEHSRFRH